MKESLRILIKRKREVKTVSINNRAHCGNDIYLFPLHPPHTFLDEKRLLRRFFSGPSRFKEF
jgi:hypothetical protein